MAAAPNPYDDPRITRALRQLGLELQPASADRVLGDLAPLLAADGIDLADLAGIDVTTLSSAFARAIEWHNLELFSPVGPDRERALSLVGTVAEALAADNPAAAMRSLSGIGPLPTAEVPSASHVIGASLGLLDAWFANLSTGVRSVDVRVPPWPGPTDARDLAIDLITAARGGEAFASLNHLLRTVGGEVTLHASVLAAGAAVAVTAAREGASAVDVIAAFLGG